MLVDAAHALPLVRAQEVIQFSFLFLIGFAVGCAVISRRAPLWGRHTVRVCPGCYRRRWSRRPRLRARHVAGTQHRTTSPTVHRPWTPTKHPCPVNITRPRLPRLLILLVGFAVIGLAGASPATLHSPTSQPHLQAYGQRARPVTFSRKRSFKRAQARALRDGTVSYRGRLHTPRSLGLQDIEPAARRPSAENPAQSPSLRIVTWNAGGLNAIRYAELLGWLQTEKEEGRPVHVMCIQETKWPYDAEYSHQHWLFVHSGMSQAQGGILFIISRDVASSEQIRHAPLAAGRALHIRIELSPPIDLLGVYQHAWTSPRHPQNVPTDKPPRNLLDDRMIIWTHIRSFVTQTPKRNSLIVLGDFNCPLLPCHPHVGPGVASHKSSVHADQPEFQTLVQSLGLTATNTWGRAGPSAGTYLHFNEHTTQIDFILTRLPFRPDIMHAVPLCRSLLVHPTGLRHVPVSGRIPLGQLPRAATVQSRLTSKSVQASLEAQPDLSHKFQQALTKYLIPGLDPEEALQTAWKECRPRHPPKPASVTPQRPCLKTYWDSKRQLRQVTQSTDQYWSPVVWHCTQAPSAVVLRCFPGAAKRLSCFFECWRASLRFQLQSKQLRQRIKLSKTAAVDSLIDAAIANPVKGLQGLYQLSGRLRPKTARRTIHFRFPDGRLMTDREELQSLHQYFQELYDSPTSAPPCWSLKEALRITIQEVVEAFRHLSARKALPSEQAPVPLWKESATVLAPHVCEVLNQALQPGPLNFPATWHRAFVTLIPKAGKPPTKPQNLRPISLLPAIPKLLARIAAERLKPFLEAALQNTPQFAYLKGRQVADSIDRVIAHCSAIREASKEHNRSVFKLHAGRKDSTFQGGLQLSLDLSKAYDRMPRSRLLQSLQHIHAPPDLISLIMYIHDNAILVLTRHGQQATAGMGRGVRQGCGLSPLLWLGFTFLLFETFRTYLPQQALTGYADDFHVQWTLTSPLDFRNACSQISRMLSDLQDFGMQPALDKTIVILLLKGKAAPKLLKEYVVKRGQQRFLRLPQLHSRTLLPVKTSHLYLGVKIGYHLFERDTIQYRLSQSWVAFYRLHSLLKHPNIPIRKRLLLWQTCVWAITKHGLTSTGVDPVGADKLVAQSLRQLRMVARSPAHITHESNNSLLERLDMKPLIHQLYAQAQKRISQSRASLGSLQPQQVHQWWNVILQSFAVHATPPAETFRIVEVTRVLRVRSTCPECGQQFPSHHALKVHIGRQHKQCYPDQPPPDKPRTQDQERYRQHARQGLPQCRHCNKKFHGWPAFTSHFATRACPVYHAADYDSVNSPSGTSFEPSTAHGAHAPSGGLPTADSPLTSDLQPTLVADPAPQNVPLFYRPELQALARARKITELIAAIHASAALNYCPECWQWCTSPSYLSRHAVSIHSEVQRHQQAVRSWAQSIGRVLRPCEWCRGWYKVRPAQHAQTCPIMWMCGHFLARHSYLTAPGQRRLDDDRPAASGGPGGALSIRGFHEEGAAHSADDGTSFSCKQRRPNPGGDGSGPRQEESDGQPGPAGDQMGERGGQGSHGQERPLRQRQLGWRLRSEGIRGQSDCPVRSSGQAAVPTSPSSGPVHGIRPKLSAGPAEPRPGRRQPALPMVEPPRPGQMGQGGRPGPPQGHHSRPHSDGGASRRRSDHLQPRLRVRALSPIRRDGQPMVHNLCPVQHGPGVEIQERNPPSRSQSTPPECSLLLHVDGPLGDTGQNDGHEQPGCLRAGRGR